MIQNEMGNYGMYRKSNMKGPAVQQPTNPNELEEMKNLLFKILVIFTLICSCSENGNRAYFQIQNSTIDTIRNISISNGVNQETLSMLNSNDKVNINVQFENVPRTDGGYQIIYFIDSKKYLKNFGYYSNGTPTNSIYSLTIKKDTILIKEYRK